MKKAIALFILIAMIFTLISCSKPSSTDGEKVKKENGETEKLEGAKSEAELKSDYKKAMALIEEEKYEEAYEILSTLGDYEDAKYHLSQMHYVPTKISSSIEQDGILDEHIYDFSYDTKNNLVDLVIKSILGEEIKEDSGKLIYDKTGSILHLYNPDEPYPFTYDENGNLIQFQDNFGDTVFFTYDNGKIVKEHQSKSDKEINYTYDENGNLIKVVSNYHGEFICDFIYDENNQLIKIDLNWDGDTYGALDVRYEYDENSKTTKQIASTVLNGQKVDFLEFIYDESGNMIKNVERHYDYSEESPLGEYMGELPIDYSYDQHGNLIKILVVDNISTNSTPITCDLEWELCYGLNDKFIKSLFDCVFIYDIFNKIMSRRDLTSCILALSSFSRFYSSAWIH